ncbi:MAG: hypothetical protein WBX22_14220 [Silvibacterium sp.]
MLRDRTQTSSTKALFKAVIFFGAFEKGIPAIGQQLRISFRNMGARELESQHIG